MTDFRTTREGIAGLINRAGGCLKVAQEIQARDRLERPCTSQRVEHWRRKGRIPLDWIRVAALVLGCSIGDLVP